MGSYLMNELFKFLDKDPEKRAPLEAFHLALALKTRINIFEDLAEGMQFIQFPENLVKPHELVC